MNHNQAPTDPTAATFQPPQEQVTEHQLRPVTGAEFVAYFSDRVPESQREELQRVGERFDSAMQSFVEPGQEEVGKLASRYTESVERGLKRIDVTPKHVAIDISLDYKNPGPGDGGMRDRVAGGLLEKVQVGRQEGFIGMLAATTTPEAETRTATGDFILAVRKNHISAASTIPSTIVDKERKAMPQEADEVAQKGLAVGADKVMPSMETGFNKAVDGLESLKPESRHTRAARFILKGSKGNNGSEKDVYAASSVLRELDNVITQAVLTRNSHAMSFTENLSLNKLTVIKDRIKMKLAGAVSGYDSAVEALVNDNQILGYVKDCLQRKGFTVTDKQEKSAGSGTMPVSSPESRAVSEVERMRGQGMSDKEVKAELFRRAQAGDPAAQEAVPYVTAYLKPRTKEYRVNGTTTKTE